MSGFFILQKSATEFCIFNNYPYLCIVRNDRRVADWISKYEGRG